MRGLQRAVQTRHDVGSEADSIGRSPARNRLKVEDDAVAQALEVSDTRRKEGNRRRDCGLSGLAR
jgi:hypothetical protein